MLLKAIRKDVFDCGQAQMAKRLNEVVRPDKAKKATVTFNQSVIHDLENRFIGFRFAHLEAYARLLEVPTGVLLLVSKYSQTNNPHRDFVELRQLLSALLDLCPEGRKSSFSVHDFAALKGIVSFPAPVVPSETTLNTFADTAVTNEIQFELFDGAIDDFE